MASRPAPALMLREGDEEPLLRLTRASTAPAGLAQRARVVLLAAQGAGNTTIGVQVGMSRTRVIEWRNRYQAKGTLASRMRNVRAVCGSSTGRR